MTADSANGGQLLSISPPFVSPQPLLFLSKESEFYIDVSEVPSQGASGALHSNPVSLQSDVNVFWNVHSLMLRVAFVLTVDVAKRVQVVLVVPIRKSVE